MVSYCPEVNLLGRYELSYCMKLIRLYLYLQANWPSCVRQLVKLYRLPCQAMQVEGWARVLLRVRVSGPVRVSGCARVWGGVSPQQRVAAVAHARVQVGAAGASKGSAWDRVAVEGRCGLAWCGGCENGVAVPLTGALSARLTRRKSGAAMAVCGGRPNRTSVLRCDVERGSVRRLHLV